MASKDTIRDILLSALPGASVEVMDLTGTSDHFQAVVVAPQFAGKTLIEQHQMVYTSLGTLMKSEIHALALRTRAPEPKA